MIKDSWTLENLVEFFLSFIEIYYFQTTFLPVCNLEIPLLSRLLFFIDSFQDIGLFAMLILR